MKKIQFNIAIRFANQGKSKAVESAMKQALFDKLSFDISKKLEEDKLVKVTRRTKEGIVTMTASCVLCIDKPAASKSRIKK